MSTFRVSNVSITGTAQSPQTIYYSDLIDLNGTRLSSFDAAPMVNVFPNHDRRVFLPALPATDRFTVALSNQGDLLAAVTASVRIIETIAVLTETNLEEMMGKLSILLHDTNGNEFDPWALCRLLNEGQNRMVNEIMRRRAYGAIPQLVVALESVDLTNDALDLTDLNRLPFRWGAGIKHVKVHGGRPINYYSEQQYWDLKERRQYIFTSTNAACYCVGRSLKFDPTGLGSIDITYIKQPVQMAVATDADDNTNCEFDMDIQTIIIGLACKDFRRRTFEAMDAYTAAVEDLDNLISHAHEGDSTRSGYATGPVADVLSSSRNNTFFTYGN